MPKPGIQQSSSDLLYRSPQNLINHQILLILPLKYLSSYSTIPCNYFSSGSHNSFLTGLLGACPLQTQLPQRSQVGLSRIQLGFKNFRRHQQDKSKPVSIGYKPVSIWSILPLQSQLLTYSTSHQSHASMPLHTLFPMARRPSQPGSRGFPSGPPRFTSHRTSSVYPRQQEHSILLGSQGTSMFGLRAGR